MTATSPLTWVLERDAFVGGDVLVEVAQAAGHSIRDWTDEWWTRDSLPSFPGRVLFHGSLGNADRIRRTGVWNPGSYCNTDAFCCSSWYDDACEFLIHSTWQILPAASFVADPDEIFERLGAGDAVFVRPDSPLKPFSGRVLRRGDVSLKALDYGFYFEDEQLPVVVAPVRQIFKEWRFVVVERHVCAGSGYLADGRKAIPETSSAPAWSFANKVASALAPPDLAYIIDICETPEGLRLVELNPFSGADLYACNGLDIVKAIERALLN